MITVRLTNEAIAPSGEYCKDEEGTCSKLSEKQTKFGHTSLTRYRCKLFNTRLPHSLVKLGRCKELSIK